MSTLSAAVSLDTILDRCRSSRRNPLFYITSRVSDRSASFASDDLSFFDDLFLFFGGTLPNREPPSGRYALEARVLTRTDAPYGLLSVTTSPALPFDGREFEFAVQESGPFVRLDDEDGWIRIAFRDDDETLFAIRDEACLFRLDGEWRKAVSIYLFCRYLRLHAEALFFHASSAAITGRGLMFIGDKGAGKSTTSLALASRGHDFLGDEVAAYVPAHGTLIPFRRPVGIKPGPRAAAVERGLATADRVVAGEGFVRCDVESLFAVRAATPAPLHAILFLRPFEREPRLVPIEADRADLARLQPIVSGFLSAPYTQRVFELVRMLGRAKIYELYPGSPDATALFLEEAFSS